MHICTYAHNACMQVWKHKHQMLQVVNIESMKVCRNRNTHNMWSYCLAKLSMQVSMYVSRQVCTFANMQSKYDICYLRLAIWNFISETCHHNLFWNLQYKYLARKLLPFATVVRLAIFKLRYLNQVGLVSVCAIFQLSSWSRSGQAN